MDKEYKKIDGLNVEMIEFDEDVELLLSCCGCADEDEMDED